MWLYGAKNGAFFFTGALTVILLLLFLLTLRRLLFFKVYIGADGFFYQTNRRNGKFYAYQEIEKAWVSSGISGNGRPEHYCNIAVSDHAVIRFPFFAKDGKGVKYLVKQANAKSKTAAGYSGEEKKFDRIDGKIYGKTKVCAGTVILAFSLLTDLFLIKAVGFGFPVFANTAMGIAVVSVLFNTFRFFEIQIGRDGFYFRTNPFNGRYYKYSEIRSCREVRKEIRFRRHGRSFGSRKYYSYFEFTDDRGKTRKFFFEKSISEREINLLRERIEKANG